jgi:hypothetical protein
LIAISFPGQPDLGFEVSGYYDGLKRGEHCGQPFKTGVFAAVVDPEGGSKVSLYLAAMLSRSYKNLPSETFNSVPPGPVNSWPVLDALSTFAWDLAESSADGDSTGNALSRRLPSAPSKHEMSAICKYWT